MSYLIYAVGIMFCLVSVGIAIANPGMTEQRLLLTYWPWYLFSVVSGFVLLYLLTWYDGSNKKA